MTSTNDGKDVKSNQTSGPKGKTYYIELYKSLDARLSGDCDLQERTRHVCDAWRRIHSLCQHSAPSTHPHLLSWLQRHTAKTVLQTEWHKSEKKDDLHKLLEEAIDNFISECRSATTSRDGISPPWECQLVQRGEWFQRILGNPWGHPTLRVLLDSEAEPPSDSEVLEWLKDERCVMFVTRLRQLAADKRCVDLALLLVSAVMDRVRASDKPTPDTVDEAKDKSNPEHAEPTFADVLKSDAGFTVDVWELLTDIEFVLLHKRDKRSKCIELAKQTPLRDGYQLVERLQSRLETSPREKKLWKNAKDIATLIAQVVITRCMVVPVCTGASRTALYCCARSLVRLLPPARLPAAAAALAAPAATARHLHTLAAAVDAQSTADMKPFVCELYVRAITAGMNELERLKLKTEKSAEARLAEQTLAAWLTQLAALLAGSTRVRCECALTAFSLHPSAAMYERIQAAPPLPPVDIQEPRKELAASEFGSWASDSRSQTNFVKTSETLNLKRTQHQTNVLSTAILAEGEALGLSPDLCQDITVLLSGPRLKTLSWDMDRELLLEKCRSYMERTAGGTRALTTELKYLNLDPRDYRHLPEEQDDDTDMYYGIEKGYEHLVEQYQEPEEIWQDAEDPERTTSAHSSDFETKATPRIRRKKKSKKIDIDSDEDLDPLSAVAEAKRTAKKKERPHSKERSKERAPAKAKTKIPEDPLATDPLSITTAEIKKDGNKEKKKRERKKKDKVKPEQRSSSLSNLIGMKISQIEKHTEDKVNPLSITDSDYDSQGKSSLNSEGNDPCVVFDGLFSMDELKSPDRNSDKLGLMKNNEVHLTNGAITFNSPMKKINNTDVRNSVNDARNVMHYSLPSPNSDRYQQAENQPKEKLRTITEDVKNGITRLLQFRRHKAMNDQKGLSMSPPIANSSTNTYNKDPNISIMGNAITKPQIPLHTQISPKPVEVPDIPKVYINKRQSEQLAELKDEMKYLLNNQNYVHKSPVQYAQKNNINMQASSSHVHTSTADIPRDGYAIKNKLPPKPLSRVSEIKLNNTGLPSQKSFQDFLEELQKTINAGARMDQAPPGNKTNKKDGRPANRISTPIKSEPKKSPQCAKQSMQQRKMENALNTFSRLSYMHKNNKSDMKLKHIEAVIEHQDHVIKSQQEQKHAKFKYLQANDLVISRVNKTYADSGPFTKKVGKPDALPPTSLVGDHPVMSNMLQIKETNALKIPIKCENQTKTIPVKFPAETRNVPVENLRDSTTPAPNRFTNLSERDQNDLVLLLRQQRKQNATQPRFDSIGNYNIHQSQQFPQSSSTNSIQPHTYNPIPCHQPTSKTVDVPSTSIPVSNTKHVGNTDLKSTNIIRNSPDAIMTQHKPLNMSNTELNCKNNADPIPNKSRKPEGVSENVAKIAKHIAATSKPTEWESVMNALLSHKTPSRGPSALEMALNQDTIDKDYAENILRAHRVMTPNFVEDPTDAAVAKDITKQPTPSPSVNPATSTPSKPTTLRKYPKGSSKQTKAKNVCPKPHSQSNIPKHSKNEVPHSNANMKQVPSDTPKKQQQSDKPKANHSDHAKRSTSAPSKKQFTCAPPKEDDPFISGIPNSDYDLLEELMDDDLRQEIGELSDDDTYSSTQPQKDAQNFAINKEPILRTPTGPESQQQIHQTDNQRRIASTVNSQQTSSYANAHSNLNPPDYTRHENVNVKLSNLVQQSPPNVIVTPNYNINPQLNQAEHAFVTTMPQQATLKNVVLLSSEIVYQPCTIQTQIPITNLASNTFVTFNNQPNVAQYQTTRFATPTVNPSMIGNTMAVPTSTPIGNMTPTTVPNAADAIIDINKQDHVNEHVINQNHTIETNLGVPNEAINDVAKQTTTQPDVDEAISYEKEQFKFDNCESETLNVNEKTDMIMSEGQKQLHDYDVEKDGIDQERLSRKRMALLNRDICRRSDGEPIPLGYVPLGSEVKDMKRNTAEDYLSDDNLNVKTDLLSTNITQNNVNELTQDTGIVDVPTENSKENNSDTSQIRILRSSNRMSRSKMCDVAPRESTKTDVQLKPNTAESIEELHGKCNDTDDIPDQRIVLHKRSHKRKKKLPSKAKCKKTNTKHESVNAKKDSRTRNKKASSSIDNKLDTTASEPQLRLPEELDIEEHLMGSKIPKNITSSESGHSSVDVKDRTVSKIESNCKEVYNNSTVTEEPQPICNINDNIPLEKQDLSCNVSTNQQNDVSKVASLAENNESEIDLTKDINDTPSKNVVNSNTTIRQGIATNFSNNPSEILISKDKNHTEGINRNNAVIKKIPDIKSIPQSYKDSIIIENLPNAVGGDDSQKKCVRIKLPSGRVFKATVHGKMNVNFDTLFSDPAIKDILLSNLTDKKRYTLNIKQVATTTLHENDKILETRVQEVKLHASFGVTDKIETINLLSDDEDDESCQYLNTEHGKFKLTLNTDDIKKHQKRFTQKCIVKLKRENLQPYRNNDQSIVKQTDEASELDSGQFNLQISHRNLISPVDLPSVGTSGPNVQSSDIRIQPESIMKNEKLDTNKAPIIAPDVIEIDDSSNDSVMNCINTAEAKITELKDLLLKDLGIVDVNDEVRPVVKDVTSKDMLSQDSNIVPNEKDVDMPSQHENVTSVEKQVTCTDKLTPDVVTTLNENHLELANLDKVVQSGEKEITHAVITNAISEVDLTEDPKSDPINAQFEANTYTERNTVEDSLAPSLPDIHLPKCYIKLTKCDNLVKNFKLINADCYVKLVRCDKTSDINMGAEIAELNDNSTEEIILGNISDSPIKDAPSRRGSFSILNCFAEFDIDHEPKQLDRCSSPVIEIYEAIAALSNNLITNPYNVFRENNPCKTDWCMTKGELHFQYKQRVLEEDMINSTNVDPDEQIASKSAVIFNAPSLLAILSKFFQDNNHITDQMIPVSSAVKIKMPRLKRKSTGIDSGVMNKICKPNKSEVIPKESCLNESSNQLIDLNKPDDINNDGDLRVSEPKQMTNDDIEYMDTNNILEIQENNTLTEINKTSDLESIKLIDQPPIVTVPANDFVNDDLTEVHIDVKDIVSETNEADESHLEDNINKLIHNTVQNSTVITDVTNSTDITYSDNCEIQNESSTTEEESLEAIDNVITSPTDIDETIHEFGEMHIYETSSLDNDNIVTAAIESGCDVNNIQMVQPTKTINTNSVEVQIETPTATEDMLLLNEECPLASSIDQTKLEPTEVSIDAIGSDNSKIVKCNNELTADINNTIKDTTPLDSNAENPTPSEVQVETIRFEEDTAIFDKNESTLVTNDECTELTVENTLYDEKETTANECNGAEGNIEIEHPVEANKAFDNNVDNIFRGVNPIKEVLLDQNETSSSMNILETVIEHTDMTAEATSDDNDIAVCTLASGQNSIENENLIAVTTEITEENICNLNAIENVDIGILNCNETVQKHEMPHEDFVEHRKELCDISNELINGKNYDDVKLETQETTSLINISNIPDHEYTASNDQLNHKETADNNSDVSCSEITNMDPSILDILEDNEISSDGSEKVLIDCHTDETYCDPDLYWSGIEFRSEIVNSEVHEKELIITSSNTEVKIESKNDQIDSNSTEDTQDKSKEDDQTSNEEDFKPMMLSPNLDSGILLKGIEFEDPEIGTCYLFPLVTSISESSECESDPSIIEQAVQTINDDVNDEQFKLNIPEVTYSKKHSKSATLNAIYEKKSRKSLKRKSDMTDVKVFEKKYRKGKGIDYPKITIAAMNETAYTKQFKCLFDYFTAIKFSYSLPFHKDFVDVHKELCEWPIQTASSVFKINDEIDEYLFRDVETTAEPTYANPKEQTTLAEEIVAEYKETDYSFSDINETNFNMGFGEGSDRVIQNLDGEEVFSQISAATLSDVKQTQPLLLSERSNNTGNITHDEIEKLRRHHTYLQMRDKVRSFFRKTNVELSYDWAKDNKKHCDAYDTSTFPFGLTIPEFIEPCPVEAIIQVVQVGQLPVSVAAQNPMTCDPRVTHVADASPSQCSAENSPGSDSQSDIKTEYTELTTADFSLHNYAPHPSMPMESPQASTMPLSDENILIETEIKSVVKIELMEELPEDNQEINENDESNYDNNDSQDNIATEDYTYPDANTNVEAASEDTTNNDHVFGETEKEHVPEEFSQQPELQKLSEKTDQIAHAMNAAGITTTAETETNDGLVNILPQKFNNEEVSSVPSATNSYPKSTAVNAMALQQAFAHILPPPLNPTTENNQQSPNTSVTSQVIHIVQGKNGTGNQITLVDNTQQSVINGPNATPMLHIVQNKTNPSGPTPNGTPTPQTNPFSGLSLVDAGLQQGGNQLLHIVNTGTQKNNNAGQLLKRVNLLTNLANVQGSNEQKMVQFVCKSADGKPLQLNGPHQRSMVLRLQPIETPNIPAAQTKPAESQDVSPTANTANAAPNKEALTPQEIKSRSIYEENYAKFIQNSSNKTTVIEKATILPKFNQAFGKQVYQDNNQKQNENINGNSLLSPVNNNNDMSECPPTDNGMNMEHIPQMSHPPLLIRKSPTQTTQAQSNLVQQIKQSIAPMNLQTMHGGVIYTRQIPVNIGNGQTINLITVPSTELVDDATQKQQSDVKFVNQGEMEPSIIKIVPQAAPNENVSNDENNTHATPNENSHTPQPQPVLTQMRIKLPMLSKTPQMVSGARVVRPSFFQIQRNVIGGANQQVYQQLVLTAAPPLSQQTIRLPQTQANRQTKAPTDNQSTAESQMSSSTLEQLREFDLVLEQVKERSTVQPNAKTNNNTFSKLHTPSTDTTDGTVPASSTPAEATQQVLYSIGNSQPLNVTYVNRKAPVAAPTKPTFVRSPDSAGIVDSSTSSHTKIPHTATRTTSNSETPGQPKTTKPKPKPRPKAASNPPNTLKLPVTPKTSTQKPQEDEQTTQRILYILAEYKEQVENSPDKNKPAPRRRTNPPLNPVGSSKRKKSSSCSRRSGVRDISPINGEDTCRTMGSEDSSCGTSQGDCNESCIDSHSPQHSPRKVVRKLSFEQEIPNTQPKLQQPRNVIVADGQTITVARGTAGKPATAVLMPANYILPVSMVKSGQQIAIVTNRGPKLLTVGGGEGGTTNALLLQRLIGPAGLKPVLTRPGVRHVRLPTAALHNLHAFNLAAAASVQPANTTASPISASTPPELIDTRANSSPWTDRGSGSDGKPERGSSSDDSEPWNVPSSTDPHDYIYEDTGRTDNMDRTVLDSVSDPYSPDMEAQRIFDKMFDVDSKKSYMIDSPRCGYDIDVSDSDDKGYQQVVHKRDGSTYRQHRLTHVSAAALRHKYAILEHELRLQKSLSEECEDLGVDSPSASELFPEAELLFAASPAHEHTQDHAYHSHTPQPTYHNQSGIPQPDMDDQIATDQLLTRDHVRDDRDLNLGLEDVGIVTVSEDGMQATIALDQEEFARSHPNTTFHSEPTDDAEVHPFTITNLKGRHITSTIFHANRTAGTVLMTAPQTTVISQATAGSHSHSHHNVKYDIDNMINSLPTSHATINLSSVLVKDDGLTRFDNLLNDTRELHLSNTASAIVHSAGNATQVIRRVCYDDARRDARFLMDEPEGLIAGDDAKMVAEDSSRDATLESMADVDDDRSSPDRQTELFWESNSTSERSERRPLDFSSDSDKCCKSPFDETNSTDSSGLGTHIRLDTVIKEARCVDRGDGSIAEDMHRPLRTYPPKRLYHSSEKDLARSLSGKTRAGERSPDALEVRRRASARGVVKRGCHCCSGEPEPAPPRPKKPRQRKPTIDFTAHH